MQNSKYHTAQAKDSLQLALARVEAFETKGAYPQQYRKEAMWADLQALAEAVNRLTKHNRTIEKNLKRFAPGTPTVEEYQQQLTRN